MGGMRVRVSNIGALIITNTAVDAMKPALLIIRNIA